MGSVVFAQPGTYLVLHEEDEGEVVAEVHVDDQGTRFALAPDRYLIQQRQREHYREYEVDVRSGEAISLARIEPRVVAYARLVRKGTDERIAAHGAFVFLNVRGPVLRDMGPAAGITAAYALDLEWASFQLRARAMRNTAHAGFGEVGVLHAELALGLVAQRFFDLPWFSVGLGLLVEGVHHRQSFATSGDAPSRSAYGAAFGAIATIERDLIGPTVLRIEGGPVTHVFLHAVVENGTVVERTMATPLTGWLAAGFGWRF
jgi:hypothetical protein